MLLYRRVYAKYGFGNIHGVVRAALKVVDHIGIDNAAAGLAYALLEALDMVVYAFVVEVVAELLQALGLVIQGHILMHKTAQSRVYSLSRRLRHLPEVSDARVAQMDLVVGDLDLIFRNILSVVGDALKIRKLLLLSN